MSAEQVSGSTDRVRDNDRPVEVTRIAEATFQDILDIGIGELAVRDATVIDRITEPGYEELIERVEMGTFIDNMDGEESITTRKVLNVDPFIADINRFYQNLRPEFLRDNDDVRVQLATVRDGYGNGQTRHIDSAPFMKPQVTLNFTLFTTANADWIWRLYSNRNSFADTGADVPLSVGGLVILGENARTKPGGAFCTVSHEVVAPRLPGMDRGTQERIRMLAFA